MRYYCILYRPSVTIMLCLPNRTLWPNKVTGGKPPKRIYDRHFHERPPVHRAAGGPRTIVPQRAIGDKVVIEAPRPTNEKCPLENNVGKTTYREESVFDSITGY